MRSEQINELATALAKAQGAIVNPPRNKTVTVRTRNGGLYTFDYADLNAVIDAIKEPLSANGLSYVQYVEEIEGKFRQVTMLLHSSGQWISCAYPLFVTKEKDGDGNELPPTSQSFGSAQTFMKRYGLCSLIGVAADTDDDANAADGNTAQLANRVTENPPSEADLALFNKLKAEVDAINSVVDLGVWGAKEGKRSYDLPQKMQAQFRKHFNARKALIEANEAEKNAAMGQKVE